MSNENKVNSQTLPQELIEQPEIKENINQTADPAVIPETKKFEIHKYKDAPENFTKNEVIQARDSILSSGLDITNPTYVNIITSRLTPEHLEKFTNHIIYSDKIIPANDKCNAIAVNSASYDGKELNQNIMNSQPLIGSDTTDNWGGDVTSSVPSNSVTKRTYYSNSRLPINSEYACGGFKSHANENLTKRYDRLVNDQGQLTKGVEKAFDNKGYPVLEAQAALQAYGSNKLCFTQECISDLAACMIGQIYNENPATWSSTYFSIMPRNLMNKANCSTNYDTPRALVSRDQTQDDLNGFIARYFVSHLPVNYSIGIYAPLTDWDWKRKTDYIGFDAFQAVEGNANRSQIRSRITMSGEILLRMLDRYYNNSNITFVGYIGSNNTIEGKWGTVIIPPTFTDISGYNTYINDTSSFTPATNKVTLSPPKAEYQYNVQDVYTAYYALANINGKYQTPYGDLNMQGKTGQCDKYQLIVCDPWYRIAHLLNFVDYDLDFSTPLDNYSVLALNKVYHMVRQLFGLYTTSITKIFGSANNIPELINSPRTSAVATRIYLNLNAMLGFTYFKPSDNNRYFIYPLAKTYSTLNNLTNVFFTSNGTYTPGSLFNDYNNVNLTGPLSGSTASLSYHVYLEDAQWWRGDMFGKLRDIDIRPIYSAGSSLSKIYQSPNGLTSVECEFGTYSSQSCDALIVDLWSDAYGTTTSQKVRTINWNNTDTVVRFVQPVLWCWSTVITGLKCAGIMTMATSDTFTPNILQASIPAWATLAPAVTAGNAWTPEMDF